MNKLLFQILPRAGVMPSLNEYYSGIQFLRFVAAFLVLCAHATLGVVERIPQSSISVWGDDAVSVKIFFVISGFVMTLTGYPLMSKDGGATLFLKRRIIRVVPLYWLATLLKLAVLLLIPSVALHSHLDWGHVLASFVFVPYANVEGQIKPVHALGWTLIYEMFFYFFFAVALMLRTSPLLVVGTFFIGLVTWGAIYDLSSYTALFFYSSPLVLLFVAGMLIGSAVLKGIRLHSGLAWLAVGLSIANMIEISDGSTSFFRWLFYSGVSSVLLVAGTVSLESQLRKLLPELLVSLGDSSYSLYLLHPFSVVAVGIVAAKVGMEDPNLVLLIMICASLALGLVGSHTLENLLRDGYGIVLKKNLKYPWPSRTVRLLFFQ